MLIALLVALIIVAALGWTFAMARAARLGDVISANLHHDGKDEDQ